MNIYLGNLSIEEIQSRVGVAFPADFVKEMRDTHQHDANTLNPGEWHCFDMPFMMACGGREKAERVASVLGPLAKDFTRPMQVGIR